MRKIVFVDENDFNKKYRSLRKYCPKSFKYLCFEILKRDNFEQEDGKYLQNIPTFNEFKAVYGQIKLSYSVKNEVVILENLEPSQFFIDGYKRELDTHKGMPFRNSQDKFKINMVMAMKGE